MYKYNNNKIIAIGDIHGDYYIFIELLKLAQVIDDDLNWIGGNTYVIQLGDTLDGIRPGVIIEKDYLNSSGEIEINELIIKLDKQAIKFGGRMLCILGNHELFPYYYADDKTFKKDYIKNADFKKYKAKFNISRDKYYKPGKGNGAKLFGNTRPLIIQLGEFLFCHGSLNIEFLKLCMEKKLNKSKYININKINKLIADWLIGNSKTVPFFLEEADHINPLFSRNLTDPKRFSKMQSEEKVNKVLKYFKGAKYIVMGHSVHNQISTGSNHTLFRIDVGLSRAFGGTLEENKKKLQLLEIKYNNDKINVNIIYPEKKIKVI